MATYLTFDKPELLWLLFSIPLMVFAHIYFMHHARKKAIIFGNFKTIERITGKKLLTKNLVLLIVRLAVFASLILAVAGTTLWQTGERSDNDVAIVIDSSASMSTQDMGMTRLEASKEAAKLFVNSIDAHTKISVVQYSGLSLVVTEPTTDRDEVLKGIDSVRIKALGGSDIAGAIVTGSNLLSSSEGGRVMVLLSDGVASLSLYEDNPVPQAIDYARNKNVVIHTIGVGTQQAGSFIPELQTQAALFDEQNLQTIASSTGGTYAWARDPNQLSGAFSKVSSARHRAQIPTHLSGGLMLAVFIALFIEWGLINTRYRLLP